MGIELIPLLFLVLHFLPHATSCLRCVHQSRAAYFSSSAALAAGACGYGFMALGFNGGYVAAGSPAIHRGGVGCGACFQIRCKDRRLCSSEGVKVILTDLNKSKNDEDLVLSSAAFTGMAKSGMGEQLKRLGLVDVEYKRIPCEYQNKNLSVRVEENSRHPNYLAIKFLYQGGQTDIVAVDVAQVGSPNWRFMNRDYGPVWSTSHAPAGPLQFRMVVTAGFDGKWVWAQAQRVVLPTKWTAGWIYDTGVQLTEIAQEWCTKCDA